MYSLVSGLLIEEYENYVMRGMQIGNPEQDISSNLSCDMEFFVFWIK